MVRDPRAVAMGYRAPCATSCRLLSLAAPDQIDSGARFSVSGRQAAGRQAAGRPGSRFSVLVYVIRLTYNGRRVLDTDFVNDFNDLSRSIRESGPRGGGAMASALFRENNPVKNDMA